MLELAKEICKAVPYLPTVLLIAYRIILALAINLDCRAKNIGARKAFTILTAIFPIIFGITYAIRRKGLRKEFKVCHACGAKASATANHCPQCASHFLVEYKNPKAKSLQAISIALCVVGLICFCANEFVNLPELEGVLNSASDSDYYDYEILYDEYPYDEYYDMKGNAYQNGDDVLLYDRDDNKYQFVDNGEDDYYYKSQTTGEEFDSMLCFVDSDGYFYYDEDNELNFDGNIGYTNIDGNIYFYALETTWDPDGSLCDINGNPL